MAPDKSKPVKKAVEAIKPSPMATRQQSTIAHKDTNSTVNIMQALKELFLPKFAQITSEIQAVQTNVQNRFQDLENAVEQMNESMEHLQVDLTQQQAALEDQLQQVLARVEHLEKETSPPAPLSFKAAIMTSPQSPSGTSASKYATTNPSPEVPHTESSASTHRSKESTDPLAGGLRFFTPISRNQGYRHVYLPARGRRNLSQVRQLLIEKANFQKGSVVDIHYPSATVAAVLVHNDYANEALNILSTKGLKPIEDFDPYNHENLGDPQFKGKSKEERTAQMKEIADKQYYITLEGLRYKPTVQLSVARDFHRKQKITTEYLQELIQLQAPSTTATRNKDNDRSADTDLDLLSHSEDEDMDHQSTMDASGSTSTLQVHKPSAGGGEPAITH